MKKRDEEQLKTARALHYVGMTPVLLILAAVLFANPYIHVLDFLPDAFAYLLLALSLRRLSWIDEYVDDAAKLFRRLAAVSAGRFIAYLWVSSGLSSDESPILLLIFTLSFGVLECIIALPALRSLFHGLSYLAVREGSVILPESRYTARIEAVRAKADRLSRKGKYTEKKQAALERRLRRLSQKNRPDGKNRTERMQTFTAVYIVLRSVLCVIPELASLSIAATKSGQAVYNWYQYVDVLRFFSFIVSTAVGILWLCLAVSYILRIRKDVPFWTVLAARIRTEEANDPRRVINRQMKSMMLCFAFCGVFSIDFFADGKNYIPTFLGAALLLLGFWLGKNLLRPKLFRVSVGCSSAFFALSCASFFRIRSFFSYYGTDYWYILSKDVKAYRAFIGLCTLEGLAMLAFFASFLCMCGAVCQTVSARAGNMAGAHRRRNVLLRRLLAPVLPAFLTMAAPLAYLCLNPTYPWMWLAVIGAEVLYAFLQFAMLIYIQEEAVLFVALDVD